MGALFSTMTSATTRRGMSSFTETTSPTLMPLKFTLPPLRIPAAGPSKTMRSGLRALVVWRDENHSRKPKAASITASVNDPIRTKFARVSIKPTPILGSDSVLLIRAVVYLSFEHDLFRKPVPASRDHALTHDRAGALAVEIGPQPRMLRGLHVGHRSCCYDFTVPQNGYAVTSGIKTVQIVGYHENGQAQSALQGPDQIVAAAGADRIKARGRLVEEDQFGIERERAGQRHALDHAARELRGKTVGHFGAQSHQNELGDRDLVEQPLRDVEIFAHRKLDVLSHGERGKQRALLEQDAPAPFDPAPLRGVGGVEIDPEHLDTPADLGDEADDGARQHRLARAGRTDEAEDFAPLHVEIEPVEDLGRAELHRDVADPDDGVLHFRRHRHIPIDAKKIANTPSITMTKKIPFTTEEVVCWPSDSALPCTASPSTQATMPITAAIAGALMMPTVK